MPTVCIIENRKRLLQNFDTPPICDATIEMIGCDAEKEGGKQILDGTFPPPIGMLKYMQKVLDHLRKPQIMVNRGPISTLISTQEHIQGLKKKGQHLIRVN